MRGAGRRDAASVADLLLDLSKKTLTPPPPPYLSHPSQSHAMGHRPKYFIKAPGVSKGMTKTEAVNHCLQSGLFLSARPKRRPSCAAGASSNAQKRPKREKVPPQSPPPQFSPPPLPPAPNPLLQACYERSCTSIAAAFSDMLNTVSADHALALLSKDREIEELRGRVEDAEDMLFVVLDGQKGGGAGRTAPKRRSGRTSRNATRSTGSGTRCRG